MHIEAVTDPLKRSEICNTILRSLPEWFAVEASVEEYAEAVRGLPFFAACQGHRPLGFAAIRAHNPYTAEVFVMGVLPEYHRQGIGSRLIGHAEDYCRRFGHSYLTVKTLDGSAAYEPYERTREFYRRQGFVPLEVFPQLWDERNPCLFLVKHLACPCAGRRKEGEKT